MQPKIPQSENYVQSARVCKSTAIRCDVENFILTSL